MNFYNRNRAKTAMIDKSKAAKAGREFLPFYQGSRDKRKGQNVNPYKEGTVAAKGWQAGWEFADVLD